MACNLSPKVIITEEGSSREVDSPLFKAIYDHLKTLPNVDSKSRRAKAWDIWAMATTSDKIEEAKNEGFEVDPNTGEISLEAVQKIIDIQYWSQSVTDKDLSNIENQYGTIDNVTNSYTQYDSYQQAVTVANTINKEHPNVTAAVIPFEGGFTVDVSERNTFNQEGRLRVQRAKDMYDFFEKTFQEQAPNENLHTILQESGLEKLMTGAPDALVTIYNRIKTAVSTKDYSNLTVTDLNLAVAMAKDASQLAKIKQSLAVSEEDAVYSGAVPEIGTISTGLFNYLQDPDHQQPGMMMTIQGFLENAAKFKGVDMEAAIQANNTMNHDFWNSYEAHYEERSRTLNKKWKIVKEIYDITRTSTDNSLNNLRTAQEVISQAINTLKIQLNTLKNKDNYATKVKRISSSLADLAQRYVVYDNEGDFYSKLTEIKDLIAKDFDTNDLVNLLSDLKDLYANSEYKDAATAIIDQIAKSTETLYSDANNKKMAEDISKKITTLYTQLETKNYYAGILSTMQDACANITALLRAVNKGTSPDESNLYTIFNDCSTFKQLLNAKEAYQRLVDSSLYSETLRSDVIRDTAIMNDINVAASQAKKLLGSAESAIKTLMENNMEALIRQTVGKEHPESVKQLLELAKKDSSLWDRWFKGMDSQNNPLAACTGSLLRKAQSKRDSKIRVLQDKVMAIEKKLRASGSDTSFMYEDVIDLTKEGETTKFYATRHIISNHNWAAYYKARQSAQKSYIQQGIRGWELDLKMADWEDANTVEIIVDKEIGRTERLPADIYNFDDDINPMKKLTAAQREYYDAMLELKGQLDSLLPPRLQSLYRPPQVHQDNIDLLANAEMGTKCKTAFQILKDALRVTEKDAEDFGNDLESTAKQSAATFESKPFRDIPVHYAGKLQDQTKLSTDFSKGMLLYGQQCHHYECMSEVQDAVEFTSYYADQTPMFDDKVNVRDSAVSSVFQKLHKFANAGGCKEVIHGFIDSAMYQEWNKTKGKWVKPVQLLISLTSASSLSTNVFGATANALGGYLQAVIEASGSEFMGVSDFLKAHGQFMKGMKDKPAQVGDFIMGNKSALINLKYDRFNVGEGTFDRTSRVDFNKGFMKRVFDSGNIYLMYATGDQMVRTLLMESVLNHQKVTYIDASGKKRKGCLNDIFYTEKNQYGNSDLKYREAYYIGEDGKEHRVDENFLDTIRGRVNYVEKSCLGAMGKDSQGEIHRYLMGQAIMNLRGWMTRTWNKRMGKTHYDADLQREVEGMYVSAVKFLKAWKDEVDGFNMYSAYCAAKGKMSDHQKANLRRVMTELSLVGALALASAMFDEEDYRGNAWARFWCYQVHRQLMEMSSNVPVLNVTAITEMINSPVAAVRTTDNLLYIVSGILNGDIVDTYKSGKNKGDNKYATKLPKKLVPGYQQISNLQEIGTSNNMFTLFEK